MTGISPVRTKVPQNVVVPTKWAWTSLKEVARLESGHTPSRRKPEYWQGGDVPWLSLKDIKDLKRAYVDATTDKPTQLGIENSSARVLPKGTVAFCRTASVGKVAILGREMATSQDFVNWVCGERLEPKYLFWALKSSAREFDREKQGSTHKTIYMPTVAKFTVLLPPLDEQKRIATILDAAEALRAKRRESLDQLDALVQSVFLDMFGDPVENPMGFSKSLVGDEISFLTSGSRGWAKYYADEGDIFIRIQNLKNGRLSLSDIAFVQAPESAEARRTCVEPGDVLVSITADLGRTAVVPFGIGKAHINQHLALLRFTTMNPVFVSYQLAGKGGQIQFARLNREGVKAGLNFDDLRSINLVQPPIDLQMRFAKIVEAIEHQKARLQTHLDELDHLFASLQQRAFAGEL